MHSAVMYWYDGLKHLSKHYQPRLFYLPFIGSFYFLDVFQATYPPIHFAQDCQEEYNARNDKQWWSTGLAKNFNLINIKEISAAASSVRKTWRTIPAVIFYLAPELHRFIPVKIYQDKSNSLVYRISSCSWFDSTTCDFVLVSTPLGGSYVHFLGEKQGHSDYFHLQNLAFVSLSWILS